MHNSLVPSLTFMENRYVRRKSIRCLSIQHLQRVPEWRHALLFSRGRSRSGRGGRVLVPVQIEGSTYNGASAFIGGRLVEHLGVGAATATPPGTAATTETRRGLAIGGGGRGEAIRAASVGGRSRPLRLRGCSSATVPPAVQDVGSGKHQSRSIRKQTSFEKRNLLFPSSLSIRESERKEFERRKHNLLFPFSLSREILLGDVLSKKKNRGRRRRSHKPFSFFFLSLHFDFYSSVWGLNAMSSWHLFT